MAPENGEAPFFEEEKSVDAIKDWLPLPQLEHLNVFEESISIENSSGKQEITQPIENDLRTPFYHLQTNFFNYQRIRLLSHITLGKMKEHYIRKYKRYKISYL